MRRLHAVNLLLLYLRNFSGRFNIKVKEKLKYLKRVLEKIKPYLQVDGGDVELVSIEDRVVKVRFLGGCSGCPFRANLLMFYDFVTI